MSPELIDLARDGTLRLPGWWWPAGTRVVGRRRLPEAWFRLEEHLRILTGEWSDGLPDLEDPATAGLLWQMLGRSRERVAHRGLGPDAGWFYHITGEIGSTGRLTLDGWAPSRCLGEACVRVAISTGRWPVVPWPGDRWWLP